MTTISELNGVADYLKKHPGAFKRKVGTVQATAKQNGVVYWDAPLDWVYFFNTAFSSAGFVDGRAADLIIALLEGEFATNSTLKLNPQNSSARFTIQDGEHDESVRGTGEIAVREFVEDQVFKADFEFSFERNGKNNHVTGKIDINLRR
ncbi:hypothetical protein RTH46_05760 [Pseudomonas sp. zfem004]|uniref:hypothetical protein n=1 Tax=unclassified Pseudomonas TaxID=196821 RepID=UPI00129B142B|nr:MULTISPECIES: hypothetical protein [unclassified Pseudomonas]MDU9401998.1 hypothetical protein [Pseudomonas sp. zfem004]